MPLGTEVGLDQGDIVLDGDSVSGTAIAVPSPHFSPHFALARLPISATAKLLF